MQTQPFVIEKTYNASPARVWKAITNKDEMKQWYFDLTEFKAEVGFEFRFQGGPSPEKQYLHICEVTEVVSEKKLTYSWRYDGYTGNSFVTFELIEVGDKTMLRFSHTGLETFPQENPDLAAHNFVTGWTSLIDTSLKNYLEKNL
jgi:uncharacterized protein YndB with AHSA1/START domain